MGSPRPTRLAVAAAGLLLLAASAASAAGLRVLVMHTANRTASNRTAATIDMVVVHATEGRFLGSVRWLASPRSGGSAHFVVSRRGQIVQLVSVTDVAWHSGNTWVNRHSIGIEHEGWTGRGGFTEQEYEASARLVAYLSHRYGIPLDRRHVIGHNEVPNPYRRGFFGGVDGHRDPGRHWRWAHYMALIRQYAKHPVPPLHVRRMIIKPSAPPPAVVARETPTSSSGATAAARPAPARAVIDRWATVRGKALWWSGVTAERRWRRHIYEVSFSVDGHVLYVDHTWPFSFHRHEGWDSRTVANGRHLLVVRAYGRHGYVVRKTFKIRVKNPPLQLAVTGAVDGGAVAGDTTVGVTPSVRVERVVLYVDGRPVSRDLTEPYELLWSTGLAAEGPHQVLVVARTAGGRRATQALQVVVANASGFPASLTRDWAATDG